MGIIKSCTGHGIVRVLMRTRFYAGVGVVIAGVGALIGIDDALIHVFHISHLHHHPGADIPLAWIDPYIPDVIADTDSAMAASHSFSGLGDNRAARDGDIGAGSTGPACAYAGTAAITLSVNITSADDDSTAVIIVATANAGRIHAAIAFYVTAGNRKEDAFAGRKAITAANTCAIRAAVFIIVVAIAYNGTAANIDGASAFVIASANTCCIPAGYAQHIAVINGERAACPLFSATDASAGFTAVAFYPASIDNHLASILIASATYSGSIITALGINVTSVNLQFAGGSLEPRCGPVIITAYAGRFVAVASIDHKPSHFRSVGLAVDIQVVVSVHQDATGKDELDTVAKKFSFMTLDDALALEGALTTDSRVLIVGAGLIGLKCAEGIRDRVGSITVCDLADRVLSSILDTDCAAVVQNKLEAEGLSFLLSDTAVRFQKNTAYMKSGKTVGFDILVLAVGVRANTALVKDAGGTVNRGIVVGTGMETDLPGVFAAGDCAEGFDASLGGNRVLAILPNAYMQGRTAGINMAGGKETFDNAIPMNSIGFFGFHMMTAGAYDGEMTEETSEETLKRFFVKDNVLRGFMLLGATDRAGIYTSLVREKTPLDTVDFELTKKMASNMIYSQKIRRKKFGGVV